MIAKNKTHLKIFLIILIIFFSCPITKISAGQITVGAMPMGAVVSFGGIRWIKIDSENTFMAVENFSIPSAPIYMQDMTADYCNYMDNFDTLYLSDQRDNKKYAVRKFPDGNCWMIDNLAYGGSTTDGCAGKSTFDGGYTSSTAGYSVYGTWSGSIGTSTESFYGSCLDPRVKPCANTDRCTEGYCSTHNCGYFYSWQAAVQNSLAYHSNDYQPPEPTVGLCPSGWRLPIGIKVGTDIEDDSFLALHLAMGYTVTGPYTTTDGQQSWRCATGCTGFWQNLGYWEGQPVGFCYQNGDAVRYGNNTHFWTSHQLVASTPATFSIYVAGSADFSSTSGAKYLGFPIRCLFSP